MHPNLPPLSAVRAFEAASRHLSFTRAGEELGMTQAAVSYQIKLLEERLGFGLFLRKARKLELTPKGQQLSTRIVDAFALMREGFEEIMDQDATILTISSNTTFAVNWLATRIHQFQSEFPDITPRILPYGPTDGVMAPGQTLASADVMISACYRPPRDWHWHELVPVEFSPFISPGLAEALGGLSSPEDLLRTNIIDPHDPWWSIWFSEAGFPGIDLSGFPSSRMGSQALEGNRAIAGQGTAILTPFFHRTSVDAGLLIQPFPQVTRLDGQSWTISYPPGKRNARKVRVFRDWLLDAMRDEGMDIPPAPVKMNIGTGAPIDRMVPEVLLTG